MKYLLFLLLSLPVFGQEWRFVTENKNIIIYVAPDETGKRHNYLSLLTKSIDYNKGETNLLDSVYAPKTK